MGKPPPNSRCPEGVLEEHQWRSEVSRDFPAIPVTRGLLGKNPELVGLDLQTEVHRC